MFNINSSSNKLKASLFIALGIVSSVAFSQDAVKEPALFITANNSNIKWNPCPDFLPKGCGLAVLHGDPAKDNVDVFFKVPPKSTIPLHWHASAERMILVQGTLRLTYEGQKEEKIKAGTYAYGPAKLAHKGYCESSKPCILFIAFESPVDAVPITE